MAAAATATGGVFANPGDLLARIQGDLDTALVTVTAVDGSTPRDTGARMLVFPDGAIDGTVGGGKLEALCIEEAVAALGEGHNRGASFDLTEAGSK